MKYDITQQINAHLQINSTGGDRMQQLPPSSDQMNNTYIHMYTYTYTLKKHYSCTLLPANNKETQIVDKPPPYIF